MRIVITGATGNIGTAMLRRLLADGEYELVGLARRPPVRVRRAEEDTWNQVRWRSVDLTRDDCRGDLDRALTDAAVVVHLAWGFQPSHDHRYLEELGDSRDGPNTAGRRSLSSSLSWHLRSSLHP